MNLKFQNKNGDYVLTKNFIVSIAAYKRRTSVQKRYGKDGGVINGDQMADTRDITVTYTPVKTNDADYLDTVNELVGFFLPDNGPFYLVDTDNDRRCEIALNRAVDDANKEGTELRIGKNSLTLEMLDAHWEDNDETTILSPTGGMDNGDTLTIDNDSDADCFPVIKITPSEINTDFTITNNTTGASLTLGSNAFVPGAEFEIDCKEGTIYLTVAGAMTEMSSALADGSGFIKFVPGNNELEYSSVFGSVDIEITYRRRYVF
jgi:phage-related protein